MGLPEQKRCLLRGALISEQIPVEFLLVFAVKMIRGSSSDQVLLAAWGAAAALGMEREEAEDFILLALKEQKERGDWPEGFMS